jgi:very-short-patch-repair endonuclease
LESLFAFDKDLKAFRSNTALERLIGDRFQGIETSWEPLQTLSQWVHTAKKMGIDHRRANTLLAIREELQRKFPISQIKQRIAAIDSEFQQPCARGFGIDEDWHRKTRLTEIFTAVGRWKKGTEDIDDAVGSLKQGSRTKLQDLIGCVHAVRKYRDSAARIEQIRQDADSLSNQILQEAESGRIDFPKQIQWGKKLLQAGVPSHALASFDPTGTQQACEALLQAVVEFEKIEEDWNKSREKITGNGRTDASWMAFRDPCHLPRLDLGTEVQRLISESHRLAAWLAFCRMMERCKRAGVEGFAMAAATNRIDEARLSDAYKLAVFHRLAEVELESNEIGFQFTTAEIDDDDATQFDNAESVLEVAQRSFQPYRRLRWHYRSQHENLIQFSNVKFYDEDLVVFPSPSSTMCSLGVVYHHVEGATCVKGENLREAQKIVERIVEHAKQRTGESLGVATFNKKQTEMIDTLVLKACESDPEFAMLYTTMREGDDGFFVKNLENIQGDERDVIFISYTYGRGPTSTAVAQRFGPINTAMGWRRLNVMVTRARKRMEVFSSMHPSDIHGGPDKSRGVNAYRDFLEYASQGLLRETGSESGREPGSPFEESVAKVVESYGLEAVFQVGVAGYFIDIGVRRRQGDRSYLLGIECDGATYHSSRSARDRDRLREEIIQGRGWDLYRIWSTDWFLNQKAEEERLVKRLQQCIG